MPVAAGIGGGSADAAAALRLLARLNGLALDDARLLEAAHVTGADVPVCLASHACDMTGVGETLLPLNLPKLPCVMVNPRVPVATKDVFEALGLRNGELLVGATDVIQARRLAGGGGVDRRLGRGAAAVPNDLEAPAMRDSARDRRSAVGAARQPMARGWRGCRGPARPVLRSMRNAPKRSAPRGRSELDHPHGGCMRAR